MGGGARRAVPRKYLRAGSWAGVAWGETSWGDVTRGDGPGGR